MANCLATFTFPGNGGFGSPPFKTGIHFESPTVGDCEAALENLDEWWTAATAFRNMLDGDLGTPIITTVGEFSAVQWEFAMVATDDPAGSAPALPGASLRAIKLASRPRGGRRGSMFWPGFEDEAYNTDGTLLPTPIATAETALNGLIAAFEATTGNYAIQLHNVGGTATETPVNGFAIAETVSFLNRRYR